MPMSRIDASMHETETVGSPPISYVMWSAAKESPALNG
jgi:hypothetical protein